MAELTRHGREIIPEELINHNPVLAAPVPEASWYLDSYIVKLSELYPIDAVLGELKAGVAEGDRKPLDYLTQKSPLLNAKGERVLCDILKASAKKGSWEALLIDTGIPLEARADSNYYLGQLSRAAKYAERNPAVKYDPDLNHGIGVAVDNGLVKLIGMSTFVVVIPSQEFAEYCLDRTLNKPFKGQESEPQGPAQNPNQPPSQPLNQPVQ